MKYYEMHEDVYQGLQKKGYISWGKKTEVLDLFSHEINLALKEDLIHVFPEGKKLRVLDLGTGTGTSALFMANLGHEVTGIDVSATAIEMAKKNAATLNLEVNFIQGDLNNFKYAQNFDLVIDSCFLHCIVPFTERRGIFESVKKVLTSEGRFFIFTMVESANMSDLFFKDYFILKDEVLWSKGKDEWDMDWQEIEGNRMFPHRRVATMENLEKEILDNGFQITNQKTTSNGQHPDTYRAWLK